MSGPTHQGRRSGGTATIWLYRRHSRAHALEVAQALAEPGEAVELTPPGDGDAAWRATYSPSPRPVETARVVEVVLGDAVRDVDGTQVCFEHPLSAKDEFAPTAVEVGVCVQTDGATVVQIDTNGDDRLRVNVNDAPVFDCGVETGERFRD